MSNATQTSRKLTESIADFTRKFTTSKSHRVANDPYKYHFPFPTHELRDSSIIFEV